MDLVREKRAAEEMRLETIQQLTDAQALLHEESCQNIIQPLKDRMIWKLECKKRETILDTLGENRSELKCDTRELETIISRLGEIEQVPVYVPHYATCHTSIVATGNNGSEPGELVYSRVAHGPKFETQARPAARIFISPQPAARNFSVPQPAARN